jgi:hypothetical protein
MELDAKILTKKRTRCSLRLVANGVTPSRFDANKNPTRVGTIEESQNI